MELNHSILKTEHNQGKINKEKVFFFFQKAYTDSVEKTLMLGEIGGRRRRGQQRMRWLDGITDLMDMSLSELLELVMDRGLVCCESWGHKESDATEQLN